MNKGSKIYMLNSISFGLVFILVVVLIVGCIYAVIETARYSLTNGAISGEIVDKMVIYGRYKDMYYLVIEEEVDGVEMTTRVRVPEREYYEYEKGEYYYGE